MRVFVAIDLHEDIRRKIARFMDGAREFAPAVRWVKPESLHVTLKFIGEQNDAQLAAIVERLENVSGRSMQIQFCGHGFFPTATAPRVFWVGIEAGESLPALAGKIDRTLAELNIPEEVRPYSPHLTLARRGTGSGSPKSSKEDRPNSAFAVLQKRLAAMSALDFGTMTANEFSLYRSQLSASGSKYTKLKSFLLS
jgi:2'-5' RNA ligase